LKRLTEFSENEMAQFAVIKNFEIIGEIGSLPLIQEEE